MEKLNIDFQAVETFLTTEGLDWATNIVFALLILFIGKRVAKVAVGLMKRAMARARLEETLIGFAGNLAYGLALAFVVIAALSQLGVETTSLAAALAAAGLAVGLALQGSLSNFAAGVMIMVLRPFTKGNYVEVGGTAGTVEEISVFNTRLKTPDNKVIIIPNSNITSNNIINYSANSTRRVDMVFGVGYGDDLKKVKAVLEELVAADSRVLKDPLPVIAVSELGASSVNFIVRPWVNAADYWEFLWDMQEAVKLRFDAEGISIPFPQQDVHLIDVPERLAAKKVA
jgi:small conductance mechanosensitive channel